MIAFFLYPSGRISFVFVTQLRYYAMQINALSIIMKVYIERNMLQLELIRYSKKVDFNRVYGFNVISPSDWEPKSSPAKFAYSLDGNRCSYHCHL